MIAPLHLGLEHPNALWLVGAGLLAFLAGLAVNLYRSRRSPSSLDAAEGTE
ncbi:hypothetical protein [Halobellus sp. GM3]|uniref:hypothetical protein n=1 Tax=Halobellus sp. GM3 TaxID=3458410 RepID=UPI00403DA712